MIDKVLRTPFPAAIYLFKVNNGNTRNKPAGIHLFKVNNETPERLQGSYHIETSSLICSANQWAGFYVIGTLTGPWRRSGVFVIDFERISHIVLVFPLLTLNKWMPTGLLLNKQLYSCTELHYWNFNIYR